MTETPYSARLAGQKCLVIPVIASSEMKSMKFSRDHMRVQCVIPKRSKNIIDLADAKLAEHFGFFAEDLDFIVNYDVKYRIGQSDESDDD